MAPVTKPDPLCLLVSVDFRKGPKDGIMIVGRPMLNGAPEIINAFQGEEAWSLYQKLITKPEKVGE